MTLVSFYVFSLLETNLKLRNISVTTKIVIKKKVITNLDLSKTSGADYIPVVVLKNCEPQLSYILASVCFPDCVGKFHRWSLYLRRLGKGLLLKTTALLVFFL